MHICIHVLIYQLYQLQLSAPRNITYSLSIYKPSGEGKRSFFLNGPYKINFELKTKTPITIFENLF